MSYLSSLKKGVSYPLKNGNIAANLPLYCQTFAIYMEGLVPVTMKMSMNGKHGKWNKTKKTSGTPFTLEKLRETADVFKR
jgi:hypothetical protein